MGKIEELMQRVFKRHSFGLILARTIVRKYVESGYIPQINAEAAVKSVYAQLEQFQLSDGSLKLPQDGVLSIDFDDDIMAGICAEMKVDEIVNISGEDVERELESVLKATARFVEKHMERASAELAKEWKQVSTQELLRAKAQRTNFATAVYESWGKSLDALELLIDLCTHLGSKFCTRNRIPKVNRIDAKLEAITRIHARSCQVAREIHSLLCSGFADGASARWRTLHELAVIASFLAKFGNETSEKYLLYSQIEDYRLMESYQKSAIGLGWSPIPESTIITAKKKRDNLVAKYGSDFEKDYGWASHEIGKKRVDFGDLQHVADRDNFNSPYKMSHKYVHASSYGTIFPLGADPFQHYLNAGGSILGLCEPGQQTAQAISFVTGTLLGIQDWVEDLISLQALLPFRDEVWNEFGVAEIEVEKARKRMSRPKNIKKTKQD